MPALSKKQQKFFGIVRAIQKGEQTPTTPETAKAAADMKKSDVKKFASTKHKGLPEKKKIEEDKQIKKIVKQLKNSSKMHKAQAKTLEKKMNKEHHNLDPDGNEVPIFDENGNEIPHDPNDTTEYPGLNKMNEQLSYHHFVKKAKQSSDRMKSNKEKNREMAAASAYQDKKGKGIKFYDKKGTGRMKDGKKVYD